MKSGNGMQRATSIVSLIRDKGPLTRASIARSLHLSPPTVGRVVRKLLEAGVICEDHSGDDNGIHLRRLLFNQELGTVLAVDLRNGEAYIVLADLGGKILTSEVHSLPVKDPQEVLERTVSLVQSVVRRKNLGAPLRALAVGVESIVDINTGVVEWAPALGWRDVPLRDILKDEFGLPVVVDNEANMAVLGERWKGTAQGLDNVVCISIGGGIGAGIIIGGELYRGSSFAAGEAGYIITSVESLKNSVGFMGALEAQAASKGVIRRAQVLAQRYPASRLADLFSETAEPRSADAIISYALEGDPVAQMVLKETIDMLTILIVNISVMLDPDIVILSGPTDWKWSRLVNVIRANIGATLERPINLKASTLGREAVVLGCVQSAFRLEGVLGIAVSRDAELHRRRRKHS